jgi:acyl carrier protein
MAVTREVVVEAVNAAMVDALGVESEEVLLDATLLGDLGAESIDLLDILFRLERTLGIKVTAGDLANHIQGEYTEEEFGTPEGVVSDLGLTQLKKVMPQIAVDDLRGKLPAEEVMGLFTVGNLVDLILARHAAPVG